MTWWRRCNWKKICDQTLFEWCCALININCELSKVDRFEFLVRKSSPWLMSTVASLINHFINCLQAWSFFFSAQVARWVTMVCMAKWLLHHHVGVPARVYVYFLHWLWYVLNTCPGRQCMQVCALHRFFDIKVHICYTIAAGCAHALVYLQFVHSRWGARVGGGVQLVYAEHLSLGIGSYF